MRRGILLLLCLCLVLPWFACGHSSTSTSTENVTLELSPMDVNVALGATYQFKLAAYNNNDTGVIWYVNEVKGGDSTHGTITQDGLYTAPKTAPNPTSVTVTVKAHANTDITQNAAVHLLSGITVAVSPSSVDLQLKGTQQFTATATGTSDNSVTWMVSGIEGGNSTIGTITNTGLYTAPASATTPTSVTVTAVSKADPTKSGSATVTLHDAAKLAVSPNPATVQTLKTLQFTATITGSANNGITWKVNGVSGGNAETGTIASDGLYTAPRSVPTVVSGTKTVITPVTITAVSQADATVTASVPVTIYAPNSQAQQSPILLGSSGGNANNSGTGTLGALVSRGGKQYVISTSQVLAPLGASSGDAIVQRCASDAGCSADPLTVANLSQFVDLHQSGTVVDAAIAEVVAGKVDLQGSVLQLGSSVSNGEPTDGAPHAGPGINPSVGLAVAKSGRSTGLTCGVIGAINVTMNLQYPISGGSSDTYPITLRNLVDIYGTNFSADGDSGALIVSQATADPVALLVASTDSDTVALPVADVLTSLADPGTGELPVFVGGESHVVSGCESTTSVAGLTTARLASARAVQADNEAQLLSLPGVRGVGITSSATEGGEPALVIYVEAGTDATAIPVAVDGLSTRIRVAP